MLQLIMGLVMGAYFAEEFRSMIPILDPQKEEDSSDEVSNLA